MGILVERQERSEVTEQSFIEKDDKNIIGGDFIKISNIAKEKRHGRLDSHFKSRRNLTQILS